MIRRALLAIAVGAERAVETFYRRLRGPLKRPVVVDPYLGYATPDTLVARGRILASLRGRDPRAGQSLWANLRQMASLFVTDEIGGQTVRVPGRVETAVSDPEGYFTLILPRDGAVVDTTISAVVDERDVALPVAVPRPDAAFGVISDIDDTVMRTGAWQLWRNLWTSFTGNALTREVFDDAVALMGRLSRGGRNPVFYVSSSPWNLHGFLQSVKDRAGLVPGPMFLRDLGLNQVAGTGHEGHKGRMIDTILAANPGLRFVLIGDTGQRDGAIYRAAAERHPGRIARVILRWAGPTRAVEADLAGLRLSGVEVDAVEDFALLETDGDPLSSR